MEVERLLIRVVTAQRALQQPAGGRAAASSRASGSGDSLGRREAASAVGGGLPPRRRFGEMFSRPTNAAGNVMEEKSAAEVAADEMRRWVSHPPQSAERAVDYWTMNAEAKQLFPNMAIAALSIYSVPLTSSRNESDFSVMGALLSPRRRRMHPRTVARKMSLMLGKKHWDANPELVDHPVWKKMCEEERVSQGATRRARRIAAGGTGETDSDSADDSEAGAVEPDW